MSTEGVQDEGVHVDKEDLDAVDKGRVPTWEDVGETFHTTMNDD